MPGFRLPKGGPAPGFDGSPFIFRTTTRASLAVVLRAALAQTRADMARADVNINTNVLVARLGDGTILARPDQ